MTNNFFKPPPKSHPFPQLNDRYATLYVALTTIIMAYGGIFGPISIVVLYAMWLPRIYYKKVLILTPTRDILAVMLVPVLACLSVTWSSFPPVSLYNASEYTSLVICTVIIAKIVRTEAFIRGIVLGSTVVLIASLLSQHYGEDPFSGNYSLIGLFGSKNQLGLFAEIGIFLSLLTLSIKHTFLEKMVYCLFPLGISSVCLFLSKSATSVLSLGVVSCIIVIAYLITRLPRSYRFFVLAVATVFFIAIIAAGMAFDWQDEVLKNFGKDSTLTGRTVLWDAGMKYGWEKPIVGHGYSAFWVQTFPPAEKLWYEFAIPGRGGFHFHNLYVELFVELGGLGVLIVALLMWYNCYKSVSLVLRHGMMVEYVLCLGIAFMFLIRSFVEVDLIGTFGIGSILFFFIIPKLALSHRQQRASVEQPDIKRHSL